MIKPGSIEIRRMWKGGPLRQWSDKPHGRWQYYQHGSTRGFTGSYVCDGCNHPVVGVYGPIATYKWLCGACKGRLATAWKQSRTRNGILQ